MSENQANEPYISGSMLRERYPNASNHTILYFYEKYLHLVGAFRAYPNCSFSDVNPHCMAARDALNALENTLHEDGSSEDPQPYPRTDNRLFVLEDNLLTVPANSAMIAVFGIAEWGKDGTWPLNGFLLKRTDQDNYRCWFNIRRFMHASFPNVEEDSIEELYRHFIDLIEMLRISLNLQRGIIRATSYGLQKALNNIAGGPKGTVANSACPVFWGRDDLLVRFCDGFFCVGSVHPCIADGKLPSRFSIIDGLDLDALDISNNGRGDKACAMCRQYLEQDDMVRAFHPCTHWACEWCTQKLYDFTPTTPYKIGSIECPACNRRVDQVHNVFRAAFTPTPSPTPTPTPGDSGRVS